MGESPLSGKQSAAVKIFEAIKDAVMTAAYRLGIHGHCLHLSQCHPSPSQQRQIDDLVSAVKYSFSQEHHSLVELVARSVVLTASEV